ncbi:hypothetical protein IFM89_002500 [Coptis chinensis]|uniref:Uncharacterized protein n=1 Tax=Coptis chinensis TaxID=261450 RepID=A0A835HKL9_9MAGN|nr:hypothetical protein IFM89_002500 [Coptis chinensis]
MEAAITSDDVVRAGGFGARDDLGSLLLVAIESTDFEASLCDARDYEEPQGETNSPGNLESEKRVNLDLLISVWFIIMWKLRK